MATVKSQIRFFSNLGQELSSCRSACRRSWVLNGVGDCSFRVPLIDDNAREEIVQFGNWVLVERDNTRPWVGKIGVWDWVDDCIAITAYTAECALGERDARVMNLVNTELRGSAGAIFRQLISRGNGAGDMNIRAGNISGAGSTLSEKLQTTFYRSLLIISAASSMDWTMRPVIGGDQRLYIYADWLVKAGERSDITLKEGVNIERKPGQSILTQTAPSANDFMALSDTASTTTLLRSHRENLESQDKIGIKQVGMVFPGVTDQATLDKRAEAALAVSSKTADILNISVIDIDDLAMDLVLGNTFPTVLTKAGFRASGQFGMEKVTRLTSVDIDDAAPKKATLALSIVG
jgi:hypothetical protein